MSGRLSPARHDVSGTDGAGPGVVPHEPVVRSGPVSEAAHRVTRFGPVTLCYLSPGAQVGQKRALFSGSFVLCVPLAGTEGGRDGGGGADRVSRRTAVMVAPDEDVPLQAGSRSPHLLVAVDGAALETALARMLGSRLNRPLRFVKRVDLAYPAVRRWLDVVRLVQDELEFHRGFSSHPVVARHLQQMVLTTLLSAVRHSYSESLNDCERVATSVPARIRQAAELIEDHAAEPLTVDDLADAVGVGVRALQQGFRRHLGTTPMAYLHEVRLKRARIELLAGSPDSGVSITDVALRCGFTHLSRFAQEYKAMFGETPSATLRAKPVVRPGTPSLPGSRDPASR